MTDFDTEKIGIAIIIGILLIIFILAAVYIGHRSNEAPYKKICEQNPIERYKEPCNTFNECVSLCTKRLQTT